MLKVLFNYLTGSFSLLENPMNDYVLMAIIGFFSFIIAYSAVGWFYSNHFISGRSLGSVLHWLIRIIVFIFIYFFVATMIRVYIWLQQIPIVVIYSVVAIIIIGILFYFYTSWKKEQ